MSQKHIARDVQNLARLLETDNVGAYKEASITDALRFLVRHDVPLADVLNNDFATSAALLASGCLDGFPQKEEIAFNAVLLKDCASQLYFGDGNVVPEIVL